MLRVCGDSNCSNCSLRGALLGGTGTTPRAEHSSWWTCLVSRVGSETASCLPISTLPFYLSNTAQILILVPMCSAKRLHLLATFVAGMAIEIEAEAVGWLFGEDSSGEVDTDTHRFSYLLPQYLLEQEDQHDGWSSSCRTGL